MFLSLLLGLSPIRVVLKMQALASSRRMAKGRHVCVGGCQQVCSGGGNEKGSAQFMQPAALITSLYHCCRSGSVHWKLLPSLSVVEV